MTAKPRPPKAVVLPREQHEDPASPVKKPRKPAYVSDANRIVEATEDPFETAPLTPGDLAELDALTPTETRPKKQRFSLVKIAIGAFGLVFSFAFFLWLDGLIQSFFVRSPVLGWVATGLVALGVLSLIMIAVREVRALMRLDSVQSLKLLAETASAERDPAQARQVVGRLTVLFADRPETARGRARLKEYTEQVIDGPHLIELAETELLAPLDNEARDLILGASKRVSVVTAISPRALVDVFYVLYESVRLVRALSYLYGGRPGTLGMMRLTRDVVGHLAVTGSLAVGDGVVQQLVGQGLANRLSAKLGEGVINGLMTARIGIAAMDLCRPLPFRAINRPGIAAFVGALTRQVTGTGGKDAETAHRD